MAVNTSVRMRCTKCQVTRVVQIERQDDVMVVPGGIVHVPCGMEMKVLSKDMRKFLNGGGGL